MRLKNVKINRQSDDGIVLIEEDAESIQIHVKNVPDLETCSEIKKTLKGIKACRAAVWVVYICLWICPVAMFWSLHRPFAEPSAWLSSEIGLSSIFKVCLQFTVLMTIMAVLINIEKIVSTTVVKQFWVGSAKHGYINEYCRDIQIQSVDDIVFHLDSIVNATEQFYKAFPCGDNRSCGKKNHVKVEFWSDGESGTVCFNYLSPINTESKDMCIQEARTFNWKCFVNTELKDNEYVMDFATMRLVFPADF